MSKVTGSKLVDRIGHQKKKVLINCFIKQQYLEVMK